MPIELIRDGKTITLQLTAGTRPPPEQLAGFDPDAEEGTPDSGEQGAQAAAASLGISVTALTPQIARSIGVDPATKGVVVVGVDPSSDAAQKQITRGFVIASVNRAPVTTPAEFNAAVARAKSGGAERVVLYVMRRGGVGGYVAVDLAK